MPSVSQIQIQRLLLLVCLVAGNGTSQATAGGFWECCDPPRAYCTPECHETWGYHQQCWRKFPPLTPCAGTGDFCPTCPSGHSDAAWQNPAAAGYAPGTVLYGGSPTTGPAPPATPLHIPQQGPATLSPGVFTPGHAPMQPVPNQNFTIPQQQPATTDPGPPGAFAPEALQPLPLNPSPMEESELPPAGQTPDQTAISPYSNGRQQLPVRPVTRSQTASGPSWDVPQPPHPGQPYLNGYPGTPVPGVHGNLAYPLPAGVSVESPRMGQRVAQGLKHFRDELFHKPNPEPVYRAPQPVDAYGQPVKTSLWSRVKPW